MDENRVNISEDEKRYKKSGQDNSVAKEPGERHGRNKVRKYANRQAFQDRRKMGSVANSNLGFELGACDRAFSISSESNTSHTELQACIAKSSTSLGGHHGCSIWSEHQLRNGIEEMLNTQQVIVRRTKMILESNEESNWAKISSDFYHVGVLHACLIGNSAMLLCFLRRGADVRVADSEGRTALHYAASSVGPAGAECIVLLTQQGANVNKWDKHGLATPLMCAAASGNAQAVEALLQVGADVNAGLADPRYPDGVTALLWAVRSRSYQCAATLIEAGAAVNSPQAYSEAPIHVAALQGDTECLRLLLEHHADVRVLLGRDRMSALHLAAEEGNIECIQLLLQFKADCNVVNARGQTPLHLAALSQSAESVAKLLEAGARHDISDNDQKTPLHCAVIKSSRSTDIVRLLISSGADVNASDQFGYAPLHLAAINENSKVAAMLVQCGADLSAKTKGGITALNFLVRRTPDVLVTIPRRLDSAVVLADHDPLDPDCQLHIDFKVLVPDTDQHRVGETTFLVTLTEAGQRHILQHPIIRAFLHLKWFKIRSLFIVSLLFHAAFVFFITANILSIYVININHNITGQLGDTQNGREEDEEMPHCCYEPWAQEWVDGVQYVSLAFGVISAIKEFFQLFQGPLEYVKNPENAIQIFLIVGVVLVNLPKDLNYDEWQQHMAALIIVVAWTELMMHVGRFPGNFKNEKKAIKLFKFDYYIFTYFDSFRFIRPNVHHCCREHRQVPNGLFELDCRFLARARRALPNNLLFGKATFLAAYYVCHDDRRAGIQGILYR